ncbi:MAG: family 78 glycoside hydrolase catalytic domain [Pseudomonadota bacterium]
MRHRAPFIWTPDQPIQHDVIISGLAGGPSREDGLNRFFFLRRSFDLDAPTGGKLHVTCDGRYRLFLNGEELGRGPARCTPTYQRYDSYDLSGKLQQGKNTLAVLVHTYGVDTSWYEMTRELWREAFGDGGLWLVADMETKGGPKTITTDTDWRIQRSDAWVQDIPTGNHGLGFVEVLDGRALPAGWTDPDFDDSGWSPAIEQVTGGGGPDAFFGGVTFRPFPILSPSLLPAQEGVFEAPRSVLWQKRAEPRSDLPIIDQPYREPLLEETELDLSALLEGGSAAVRTSPGQAVTFLLDFGRIVTGHPTITLEAKGGETIDLAVAEGIPGEWEPNFEPKTARIIPAPLIGADVHLARYTAHPGEQTFERFDWQAVRYLQVTVRDADDGVILSKLGVETRNYPVTERGSFRSNDPFLDDLWKVGRYTLHQCMHDGWEDCPSREQRQWSGDATVENLVGHVTFGPAIAPLNAEYLKKTAESQRADGLTQMFAPGNHGHTRLLIPDWTLQWILNARDHLLWSNDEGTVSEVWPSIVKALAWFRRARGGAPLVADMPHWHFMDWAALGRSGYATTLNAQLAGCLDAAAWIGTQLGDERTAASLRLEADDLRTALESHWDENRGIYIDMRDPESGALRPRVSQHANAAMILWGGAPETRYDQIFEAIMDEERLKFTAAPPIKNEGEAVNEETDIVLTNTFYSHYLYAALNKAGRTDLVLEQARRRYRPMLEAGATTLWESYGPTASLCHGFSASPTYQMSTAVLGIEPTAPGARELRFSPHLAGLERAQGRVPLTSGEIEVHLEKEDDGFTAQMTAPSGVTVNVEARRGLALAGEIQTEQSGGLTTRRCRFRRR